MDKLKDFSTDDFKADSGTNITWAVFKNKLVKALNAIKDKINEIIAGKCEVVVGSYVGKCEALIGEVTAQEINLGFRPNAVEIFTNSGDQLNCYEYAALEHKWYGGLALDGSPLCCDSGHEVIYGIEITDNGFICRNYIFGKNYHDTVEICKQGTTYYYKAYKNCTRKDFS